MSLTSQQQAQTGIAQETALSGDIEVLRQILIKQKHSDVTQEEAREVGDALVEFYVLLATEMDDESTS